MLRLHAALYSTTSTSGTNFLTSLSESQQISAFPKMLNCFLNLSGTFFHEIRIFLDDQNLLKDLFLFAVYVCRCKTTFPVNILC